MAPPDVSEIECPPTIVYPRFYDMDDISDFNFASPNGEEKPTTNVASDTTQKYLINITEQPLKSGIKLLNSDLLDLYKRADEGALHFQETHRRIAIGAIILGFLAILFAIVQFCLLSLSFEMAIPIINMDFVEFFRIGEFFAIIFAAMAVIAGLYRSHQNRWLINRHIAERCRLLKFRSFLNNKFWNEAENKTWEENLRKDVADLFNIFHQELGSSPVKKFDTTRGNEIKHKSLPVNGGGNLIERWIKEDKIPASSVSSKCTYSHQAKTEFLDYYRKKRLIYQRDYYYCAYKRFKKTHIRTQKIPHMLFFASVCAVLAHFILDLVVKGPVGHVISITLIGVAVTLPFAGAVVRTHRETFQVARSSALYYAKYSALENLNNQLSMYENSVDENWKKILDTLWECENFLEAEHREWLILIHDAEWFL